MNFKLTSLAVFCLSSVISSGVFAEDSQPQPFKCQAIVVGGSGTPEEISIKEDFRVDAKNNQEAKGQAYVMLADYLQDLSQLRNLPSSMTSAVVCDGR